MSGQAISISAFNIDGLIGEVVTVSGTSAQSGVIEAAKVHLSCDVLCFIETGVNPVAVSGTGYALQAGGTYEMTLHRGYKIAAIGAGGSLWIHPVN